MKIKDGINYTQLGIRKGMSHPLQKTLSLVEEWLKILPLLSSDSYVVLSTWWFLLL